MNTDFHITYHELLIRVEQQDAGDNTYTFTVHLPDDILHIQGKQDNEGAYRWLDADTNQETPESKEIGELIDLYLVQQQSSL